MAEELTLNGRRYWILSEPEGARWKARAVEVIDAEHNITDDVGIEASDETRGAADAAAERKLRRLLRVPEGHHP